MKIFMHVAFGALIFAVSEMTFSAPASFVYQGRIMTMTGAPLEYAAVSFEFTILAPNGTCVLYKEQTNNVDMRNSKGVFEVPIGAGLKSYPSLPSVGLLEVFNNDKPLICEGGSTYSPQGNHGRILRVQFYDGAGWRLISPDSVIRSVPYAAYAGNADKLGSKSANDFVGKPATCTAGQVISFDGANFNCSTLAGGGGSGTVTEIFSANSYLSVTNSTTTPTLTVNVGASANTVAAGNDARFSNARVPTGSAGGDLAGTYPSPSVAKIQGVGVDFSTAPGSGEVLTFDGINWVSQALPATSSGTVTGVTAGSGLTGGTIHTSGTIGLGTALTGLNAVATNGYIQRTGAGTYSTTTGNITASNNTLVLRDGSGVSSFYGVGISGSTSGAVTLQAPLISGTYSLTFPDAQGAANQVMANDGNGILSWINVPAAPGSACGAGNVLTYNGTAFTCVPDQVGSAGGGIVSLNSQTGSAQSFGNGTAGNLPNWSSASDVHTLNIPYARNNGVTAGLISKNEYDIFNGKQNALTYVPLDPSKNLSDLLDISTARTNLGLGTSALKDVPASGNAATSEVVMGDDTRLTNSRTPSGSAGGDLGGTYPNPDVNRIKGVGMVMTSLTSGNFLKYNGTNWINAMIAQSDVTGLTTALSSKLDQSQISGTCAANSTLVFSSVSGTWTCTNIGIADSQVTFGSKSAKTFLAAPTGGAGAPTFRTIASTDLPASITDAAWTADGSGNISRATGNVGIGTASPLGGLHVQNTSAAEVRISGDSDVDSASLYLLEIPTIGNESGFQLKFDGVNGTNGNRLDVISHGLGTVNNRMSILRDTGYVGIGTTSPLYRLHINGDSFAGSSMILSRAENAGSGPGVDFWTARGSVGTAAAQTLANHHIGQLNFYGTDETGVKPPISSSTIRAFASENTTSTARGGGLSFLTVTNGDTSLTEKIRISGSGNVGIGTTNPEYKLHIQGDSYVTSSAKLEANRNDAGSAGYDVFRSRGTASAKTKLLGNDYISGLAAVGYDGTNYENAAQISVRKVGDAALGQMAARMIFSTRDSAGSNFEERMTIDPNGNVGIGTSLPSSLLEVAAAGASSAPTTSTDRMVVRGSTNTTINITTPNTAGGGIYFSDPEDRDPGGVFYSHASDAMVLRVNDATRVTINSAGNVGIGTGSPSQKLHVVGNIFVDSTYNCTMGNASGSVSCSSDERLKENIKPIPDALKKVLDLRGVEFDWNQKSNAHGRHDIGVIAQEVEKVFPSVVHESNETGMKMVDYGSLVAPLIAAVKELFAAWTSDSQEIHKKMSSLEKENSDLKSRVEALEKIIQQQKK